MAAAEFDYIVVGAGAALAARLGEAGSGSSGRTTCVIEAGGADTHPFLHLRRAA